VTPIDSFEDLHEFRSSKNNIHSISIEFQNKTGADTRVDEQGQIVEDLYLVIDNLNIDGHDLMPKISRISHYQTDQGIRTGTHNWMAFAGLLRIKLHRNLLYTLWMSSTV